MGDVHEVPSGKEIETRAVERRVGIRIRGREGGWRYDLFLRRDWSRCVLRFSEVRHVSIFWGGCTVGKEKRVVGKNCGHGFQRWTLVLRPF